MRVFFSYLAHESSSFSPIPTGPDSFERFAPDVADRSDDFALLTLSRERGHDLVVGPMATATPSAPASRSTYEGLRNEILQSLREALPIDAVLLFLHGAQLAEGYDDCEGDLLARVRALVGPDIPIGVELDLHCNLTPRMVAHATAIIPCKEYPHSDFRARAAELLDIVEAVVAGRCRPFMVLEKVPMLGMFHTSRQPMRGFVDDLIAREGRDGVLSIGLAHGFGYADTPETGAAVLVVAEGDRDAVEALARGIAARWFALREEIVPPALSLDEGLDRAVGSAGPVVIADSSDNPGGGAAGDSTHLLRGLLDRGIRDAALGMIWDPVAAVQAMKAGVGSSLNLRLGGKVGPMSGDPLDVRATVLACRTDATQNVFGASVALDNAVALEIEGIQVVANSVRQQVIDPACFTALGIDPWHRRIIVVKSAQHFHDLFAPHAGTVLYVDTPGTVSNDWRQFAYRRLGRPLWPLDPTPFERDGRTWR